MESSHVAALAALQQDDDYACALSQFRRDYPAFDVEALADLRAREYGRLDALGHVYLDYTGGGLYAAGQLAQSRRREARNCFRQHCTVRWRHPAGALRAILPRLVFDRANLASHRFADSHLTEAGPLLDADAVNHSRAAEIPGIRHAVASGQNAPDDLAL